VVVALHILTAALYLGAGVVAGVGLVLPSPRALRGSVSILLLGAVAHAFAFAAFHLAAAPPPLTDLPAAVSLMAWLAVLFFLALLRRVRLQALVAGVAPAAFLGAFYAALRLPHSEQALFVGSAAWPHAHVLLSSAGFALLGLAGIAGVAYLGEDRRLKAKPPGRARLRLPSLEALDRVNAVALAAGFPLLTVGVLTGMMWVETELGRLWTGSPHEIGSVLAWLVYGGLLFARVRARQPGRRAALAAVAGFAFLLFAVVGVGLFA